MHSFIPLNCIWKKIVVIYVSKHDNYLRNNPLFSFSQLNITRFLNKNVMVPIINST